MKEDLEKAATDEDRLKELSFLSSLSRILYDPREPLEKVFRQVTQLIPEGWIGAEIISVQIAYEQMTFNSKDFIQSQWSQSSEIRVHGAEFGTIEVFYTEYENIPDRSSILLSNVAHELGKFIERRQNHESLNKVAKEIVCLRSVSQLLANTEIGMEQVFETFVHLVPEAWHYPQICRVRVSYRGLRVDGTGYAETEWVQTIDITNGTDKVGEMRICYLEERPEADEGPFHIGERYLLESLAREVSGFIQRIENEELKKQQHRELELYSSLIRHDLINDIQVIAGYIDISNQIHGGENSELRNMLDSALAICMRMNGVLDAFKKLPDEIESHPIRLVEQISKQAEEAYVNLVVTISSEEDMDTLRVPSSRLLPLVFDNLFRNSVQFCGEVARVEIVISKDKDALQISFTDNGKGIAEEVKGQLFRKGISTGGGGMGLYLSKQVLLSIGGTIELADPQPKKGAKFVISIPITK
ncbi:MAG: sensor histidine kinase [Candidatus Thorarchaeota archaeon]